MWTISADGTLAQARRIPSRIAFPAWTPRGEIACIATIDGRPRITSPCGGAVIKMDPDLDVYGPFAFALDGTTVYASLANTSGTVDLWAAPVAGGRARRLTSFSRDTYAPSIAADRSVTFKVQSYRTVVALAPAEGGPSQAIATFQSETPSWDPTGRLLGITYGTWRRVVDDAKYPDIAQDAGIIAVDPAQPATQPSSVVHASDSEDQALCWSPNGRWVAFHSHKDQSDDIWLREADATGDATAAPHQLPRPRRRSRVAALVAGRPLAAVRRREPDDAPVGGVRRGRRSGDGSVTRAAEEIAIRGAGLEGVEVSHAEWLPDSAHVAVVGKEGPGRHVIFTVAREAAARASSTGSRRSTTRPASASRRTDAMSRSSRRRPTGSFRCSGCRLPVARPCK